MLRVLTCFSLLINNAQGFHSISVDPRAFKFNQPDNETITIRYNGGAHNYYATDEDGFTAILDDDGYYVYAKVNERTGYLEPTGAHVGGNVAPLELGLEPYVSPSQKVLLEQCGDFCKTTNDRTRKRRRRNNNIRSEKSPVSYIQKGILKNLVVMICFDDHDISNLPTVREYEKLFNSVGGNSVKDVLLTSSYNKLQLESHIYGWVKISKPQKYYSHGQSGLTERIHEGIKEALKIIDDTGFDWSDFDRNGDGSIDSIAILHSGYAAEFMGVDCTNSPTKNRIWSHKWSFKEPWSSRPLGNKHIVNIKRYHMSSGLWDSCGEEITRVGVIAHETGHFLGLEDYYDGSGGNGIGNFGLMGNAWGFNQEQTHPPTMTPWNKIELGWLEPTVISESGTYEIRASYNNPTVYKIEHGFPDGEYLLIENRQRMGFDSHMPQGGLLIWHIDEKASLNQEGYPGQSGWPYNGKHYKVALLQADGKYDLEKGISKGDAGDVFHANGVHSICPTGTSTGSKYPDTSSYQEGTIQNTGIIIDEISESGPIMSFRLTKLGSLRTSFAGWLANDGIMFDVFAKKNLLIYSMNIHTAVLGNISVEVWSKRGSWQGFENQPDRWTFHGRINVNGKGLGKATALEGFKEIVARRGYSTAIYVTMKTSLIFRMVLSKGDAVGKVIAYDKNINIKTGVGKKHAFGKENGARNFDGRLRYRITSSSF